MAYMLVCEGACNPQLPVLEAAVRAERHTRTGKHGQETVDTFASVIPGKPKSVVPPVSDDLGRRLRDLVHTSHVAVPRKKDRYTCSICGCARRF